MTTSLAEVGGGATMTSRETEGGVSLAEAGGAATTSSVWSE